MTDQQLEYLIEQYADTILRLAYSYLKNVHDAQDISQSVLEKLYVGNQKFQDSTHEKGYIMRMTVNLCKDYLKSAHHRTISPLELCEDVVAPEESDGTVLFAVNQLEEKYRITIYLHYFEGYTANEIGKILKTPAPTIRTRLVRGREKLKILLGGQDDGTIQERV
ncbi:MAG: sigma-70 family RNA polymerase sigma factor [Eubacteriales bacterium]